MNCVVKNYKVNHKGKVYGNGDIICDVPNEEVIRLVKLGYVDKIGEVDLTGEADNNQDNQGNIEDAFLMNLTVDEGKQWADNIDDIKILEDAIIEEKEGKNRKGLLQFIEARIKEFSQVE
ncbi:hypothetical protein [Vallitalea guaymasensis]|uniref:hypothetical protein n=1 Tax=Vallitalea guaymasensis TaxID=1185412 RepID=UPI002356D9BC|nr:hypothetical protein [Vallitalea guaymasensis]